MLTRIVASQAQRSNVAPTSSSQQRDSSGSRVNKFLQLDPPVFTGANPENDPQDFIDEMHKTLRVMRASDTERVELAAYLLKRVAYSWFELWEDSREEGSPPARWSAFADAFMDHLLPTEIRAARVAEFENLKQGSRSVYQRSLDKEIHRLSSLGVRLADSRKGVVIVQNRAKSSLVMEMKGKQYNDPLLVQLKEGIHKHKTMGFSIGMDDGTLRYQGRLCVTNVDGLRERIMIEAHTYRYLVHPGSTKNVS
ncbi:uncharacterized protein [Nicotiana tomentosiformis]|uniref:uncharacterized protein n=1 Tax=Nicotiana tomentosiformis TaxID=4098 RepID=UPI00388C74FE